MKKSRGKRIARDVLICIIMIAIIAALIFGIIKQKEVRENLDTKIEEAKKNKEETKKAIEEKERKEKEEEENAKRMKEEEKKNKNYIYKYNIGDEINLVDKKVKFTSAALIDEDSNNFNFSNVPSDMIDKYGKKVIKIEYELESKLYEPDELNLEFEVQKENMNNDERITNIEKKDEKDNNENEKDKKVKMHKYIAYAGDGKYSIVIKGLSKNEASISLDFEIKDKK